MPNAELSIYIRKKNAHGQWESPRKVRELRGRRTGDLKPPFYIRPLINGKQTPKLLMAQTYAEAKEEAASFAAGLKAKAKGLQVPEIDALNRPTLRDTVRIYLEQKSGKAPKTIAAYRNTLEEFAEAARVQYLDQVTESVLRRYKNFMEQKGHAGKTQDTRLNIVYFMLKKNDIKARLPKDEMPVVDEEPAVPYTDDELKRLFEAMNDEERLRYKFFLGSACREREVSFASWNDIDWSKGEYHVRRKEDVGFTPKSHESRTVPLPQSLLKALKDRQKNPPHQRWIFVNGDGKPESKFLEKLKRIALHAGLNCGHCTTKKTVGRYEDDRRQIEVSCKEAAVCGHIILHRFRKTCATRWMEHNVPIRTIQQWLGHKSLETTMRYLGVTDSSKLQANINEAFGD